MSSFYLTLRTNIVSLAPSFFCGQNSFSFQKRLNWATRGYLESPEVAMTGRTNECESVLSPYPPYQSLGAGPGVPTSSNQVPSFRIGQKIAPGSDLLFLADLTEWLQPLRFQNSPFSVSSASHSRNPSLLDGPSLCSSLEYRSSNNEQTQWDTGIYREMMRYPLEKMHDNSLRWIVSALFKFNRDHLPYRDRETHINYILGIFCRHKIPNNEIREALRHMESQGFHEEDTVHLHNILAHREWTLSNLKYAVAGRHCGQLLGIMAKGDPKFSDFIQKKAHQLPLQGQTRKSLVQSLVGGHVAFPYF